MVKRDNGKIKQIILERKSDIDLLKGMDGKLDTIITGHAVLCNKVETHAEIIKTHGKRITWVERILWTAIGGGVVIVWVVKVFVK